MRGHERAGLVAPPGPVGRRFMEALPGRYLAPIALLAAGCTGQIGAFEMPGEHAGSGPAGSQGSLGASGELTCTAEAPSPRILRQLTRTEYGSTVSDLLGIAGPNITSIPPDNQ